MSSREPEQLFRKHPSRKIEAFDFFDTEHERDLANFRFRPSAYGILIKGDKVLMQRHPALKTFGLPGGGVEIDETIIDALVREFEEETGLIIEIGNLLYAKDDFFTHKNQDAHGILLFYEVNNPIGKLLKDGNQSDTEEVKYMKLSELTMKSVQRVFWPVINLLKGKKIEVE